MKSSFLLIILISFSTLYSQQANKEEEIRKLKLEIEKLKEARKTRNDKELEKMKSPYYSKYKLDTLGYSFLIGESNDTVYYDNIVYVENSSDLVNGIISIQESFPKNEKVNVNNYFKVLDQVNMKEGYVLDYLYYNIRTTGLLLLYAREINNLPFDDIDQFNAYFNSDYKYLNEGDFRKYYRDKIEINGTPDSYYQLSLLLTIGHVFNFIWHANYQAVEIIHQKQRLLKIIKGYNKADKTSAFFLENIDKINLKPRILSKDNKIIIEFLCYYLHEGIILNRYIYDKNNKDINPIFESKPIIISSPGFLY